MGILADVNPLERDGLDYIEIIVNPSAYSVVDTGSRGIMVLCKPCEKYNKLLRDKRGKEILPNVKLEKLAQEEQDCVAPILKYLDDNSIITNAIGRDLC